MVIVPKRWMAICGGLLLIGLPGVAAQHPRGVDRERIYRAACAACHGADGTGTEPSIVAFAEELPDFTDCGFASREPDSDWIGVAHEGGPARAFSRMMPAFGEAMSREELAAAMAYVRSFCADESWPRGELNLPRLMFTEKAYPEDEAVIETATAVGSEGSVESTLIYEQRVGPRSQFEVVVPFAWIEQQATGAWLGGIGDLALGVKHALAHSKKTGTIVSLTGEVILPTGKKKAGLGKGAAIFEPFVSFGQILPADSFVQIQAGLELPFAGGEAETEVFWRGGLGSTWSYGEFGRAWTPAVEVLGARALEEGVEIEWAVVPQMQVTLSTRQHIMGNVALRIPVGEEDFSATEVHVYLLWDWFDGGFFEGW